MAEFPTKPTGRQAQASGQSAENADKAARSLAEKRKVAWIATIGALVGSIAAGALGASAVEGILWGVLSGAALGWLWIGLLRVARPY